MPLAPRTCAEALAAAEEQRRSVLATLKGKALERALAKADKAVEDARNRHDCI